MWERVVRVENSETLERVGSVQWSEFTLYIHQKSIKVIQNET